MIPFKPSATEHPRATGAAAAPPDSGVRPAGPSQPGALRGRLMLLAGLVSASVLTGCGGGLYLTVPVGGPDSSGPPAVALSPLPGFVQPGGVLTLGAAASSSWGIDQVAFYRIDGNRATFLGADSSPPFQWSTVIPGDGRGQVAYFASATDGAGRVADSQVVAAPVVY